MRCHVSKLDRSWTEQSIDTAEDVSKVSKPDSRSDTAVYFDDDVTPSVFGTCLLSSTAFMIQYILIRTETITKL